MRDDAEPAELLMCLESRRHPELPEMWAALEDQWMVADPRSELYPVQLMAYGLWAHDHVHHSPCRRRTGHTWWMRSCARSPDCP
ncbi:hypothetical protein QP028_10260 [Corynebacterium suedekumii]|nr:hypothetical protein QP028_10260 [Corynebacterium suedekumii]